MKNGMIRVNESKSVTHKQIKSLPGNKYKNSHSKSILTAAYYTKNDLTAVRQEMTQSGEQIGSNITDEVKRVSEVCQVH